MRERKFQQIDLETGVVVEEMFRRNGKLHRDESDGPAWTMRDFGGQVVEERFYRYGLLHRKGGAAMLRYSVYTGLCYEEFWYWRGKLHRDPDDGPAFIARNDDGTILTVEIYLVHGRGYRDPASGPWHIERRDDGTVRYIDDRIEDVARPRHRGARPGRTKAPSP